MCVNCWHEDGAPTIDTPAVRWAAATVRPVYEHNGVGGNLHVLLDDFNLDDGTIEFEWGWMQEKVWQEPVHADQTLAQLAAEWRCLLAFAALSFPERASALALADGYWR